MEKQKRDGALDAIEWRILKNLLLLVFAYALGVMMSIGMQKLDVMSYSAKTADKNKVAITFDDGPNPEYTVELLEGLQKRGVKATFFVLGAEVEKYPDIVKKIDDGGHLIGVHSYEHVNFGQIGDEAAIEQIEKTQEAIHNVTGKYAGYIRPPYGCWKKSLDVEVPLIEVLWDIDPLDWATKDADTVVQRILKGVTEGSIILLHDASQSSVQAAFSVIDILQQENYEFVTVEDLLLE
ncbi:MAG: polysaccharide deacetylase family protein [Lachnobacterium sp.]|nr:polysaccharide deacetylase family protein [Lachnobacterium sp.]MCI7533192.1 polysaccharide deacetylase family protein [Lachnobacterium sp.]MDD7712752.1 polysaccharide deacetylase family protein [Lachnobacterium sp.]MDY5460095.1 polysaccharide deacetylase family protein [Agathobacter sp.]